MKIVKLHEKQRLMRFRADDGFLITAFMVTPDYQELEEILEIPILLQIHGSLGHFLARGTPRLLPHALLDRGYSSLSINTRLANAGQMTGQVRGHASRKVLQLVRVALRASTGSGTVDKHKLRHKSASGWLEFPYKNAGNTSSTHLRNWVFWSQEGKRRRMSVAPAST